MKLMILRGYCSPERFKYNGIERKVRYLGGVDPGAYYSEKKKKKGLLRKQTTVRRVFKGPVSPEERDLLKAAGRLKGSEPHPDFQGKFNVKMRYEEGLPLKKTAAYQTIQTGGSRATCEAWIRLIRQLVYAEHARMANKYGIIQQDNNHENYLWKDVSNPTAEDAGVRPKIVDFGGARKKEVRRGSLEL
jgi:hypothetical protein